MKLSELLADIPLKNSEKIPDIKITNMTSDSRTVSPGNLFLALEGIKHHGLFFANDAIKNGAVAILSDTLPQNQKNFTVPFFVVSDPKKDLQNIVKKFFTDPTKSFYLAGVTGTNGKTTLTYLLEKIFAPAPTGVIGTVNIRYPGFCRDSDFTTPDLIELNRIFSNMKKEKVECAAIEVSSHALKQNRVVGLHFDTAVFTNLTQDHLDYHSDMEDYFAAKKKLFTDCLLTSQKEKKSAVINIDDDYGKKLLTEIQHTDVYTYSISNRTADLFCENYIIDFTGTQGTFNWRGRPYPFSTNLIGKHNLQNIMAALLAALPHQKNFLQCLEKITHVNIPGRLERVGRQAWFVDYAHTPDALDNVLQTLFDIRKEAKNSGRIITVFGCGGDRDRGKRPRMGMSAAKFSDVVIVTSDNPRTEDPEKILADIRPGVESSMPTFQNGRGALFFIDRKQAIEEATKLARPEDIILVAGKGHETYQILGNTKHPFDDREILRKVAL